MTTQPLHSTGRGGAGNIGHDENIYTDGGIVREGAQGESVAGEFSTGRGGAGNMGKSPRLGPTDGGVGHKPTDFVPEISTREAQEEFHTGRGGAGNVYKEKHGGHSHSADHKGFGDKIKDVLHMNKDKKHEPSPLANNETATNH